MIQTRQPAGIRIKAGEIWALDGIAPRAGERQVSKVMGAAMLLGNDVLDMKRVLLLVLLAQAAVFAAIARTIPYLKSRRLIHASGSLAFQKQSGL